MEDIVSRIPIGRLGKPDEFGKLVSFLASDHAGFITGQAIGYMSEPFHDDESERFVARYIERAPLSLEKLLIQDDIVIYTTKEGVTHEFDALEFLALLSTQVPAPYESLTRYCRLPSSPHMNEGSLAVSYDLIHGSIELHPITEVERVELYTVRDELKPRYRLTYKVNPVYHGAFVSAWDRSFSQEIMYYPVLSVLEGERHVYLQKNKLLIRSTTESTQVPLTPEELALELGPRIGIAPEVLKRAPGYVRIL